MHVALGEADRSPMLVTGEPTLQEITIQNGCPAQTSPNREIAPQCERQLLAIEQETQMNFHMEFRHAKSSGEWEVNYPLVTT